VNVVVIILLFQRSAVKTLIKVLLQWFAH